VLERIAAALERLAPRPIARPDFAIADAFVWHPEGRLIPVPHVNRVEMTLLKGIDRVRDVLVENTERFAKGLPANNALLWGARGMGKSSLAKASHAAVNVLLARQGGSHPLKLIEIHREDIESLPDLMTLIRATPYRFIIFCDDLSFDTEDTSYKSLKAVLEGGIEGRPPNVIFYATSNRRHLMSRAMLTRFVCSPPAFLRLFSRAFLLWNFLRSSDGCRSRKTRSPQQAGQVQRGGTTIREISRRRSKSCAAYSRRPSAPGSGRE